MTVGPEPGVRAHHRDFYDGLGRVDRAVLVVVGNCQAESLRMLLESDDVVGVRMPAVHELTAYDVAPLHRLVGRADLLVSQPVADDYHGLPVGTAQLRALLPARARVATVPSVRYAGLHPYHLLVHPPGLDHADPPLAPYHDLRTAVEADHRRAGLVAPAPPPLTDAAVRAVGHRSLAMLRVRQQRHGTIAVDDLLVAPGLDAMRTVNHPGNVVLGAVAARLRERLGLPARPPGTTRPLLDHVLAPRDPAVVAERDPGRTPTDDWTVGGRRVPAAEVREAHLAHYDDHPTVLDAVLERGATELDLLGLSRPGRAR